MIHPIQKGFSLIEMLVVLGIFAVMTSVVVFNYGKFTSETILTNMAYEVALSLREAQIYGVSVRTPDGSASTPDFRHAYGIHFPKNSSNYYLFADTTRNDAFNGTPADCANPGSGECVTVYGLQRGIIISEVRTKSGNNTSCGPTNESSLDIVFRRPDPSAVIRGGNHSQAQITLRAPNGSLRYVVVSNNGQMYVTNTPICTVVN